MMVLFFIFDFPQVSVLLIFLNMIFSYLFIHYCCYHYIFFFMCDARVCEC